MRRLSSSCSGLGPTHQLAAEEDVGPDRHVAGQREVLVDGFDPGRARLGRRGEVDRLAVELDGPAVRAQDGAEDPDQGRFAGAVVADQPGDLPGDDVDRDVVSATTPPKRLLMLRACRRRGSPCSSIRRPTIASHHGLAGRRILAKARSTAVQTSRRVIGGQAGHRGAGEIGPDRNRRHSCVA